MFIGKYNKSVIITYVGVISSFIGMYFASFNQLWISMICLIISGICDLFDGKVARMCKRDEVEKEFGKQLDSLADVFMFLGLPSVIGLNMFSDISHYTYLIILLYIIAGIIRLAYFNMNSSKDEPVKFYTGLPVTFSALIFPLLFAIEAVIKKSLIYVFVLMYFLVAVLFILKIKIPKPKGIWYAIFSFIAIGAISVIIWSR